MHTEIRMQGLEEATALLECAQAAQLLAAAGPALTQSLERIRQEAVLLCPVDTGTLAASLQMDCCETGNALEGSVSAQAPHAVYVELGTGTQAAQPYLYPAMAAYQTEVVQQVFSAVLRGLKSGGKNG